MKTFVSTFILFFILFGCADNITESEPSVLDPGNTPPASEMPATFSAIQSTVFNTSCAVSGCHNGSVTPDLRESAYNRIVNRPSAQSSFDYIEPNKSGESYLYLKLLGTGISGDRMPRGRAPLSQAKLDSIKKWIDTGAANN
jgi:hypothetical protein